MNTKQINLGILDGQEEDVLEKIARYIEIARLRQAITEKAKLELENLVLDLEGVVQDLKVLNQNPSNEIVEKTLSILRFLVATLADGTYSKQEIGFLKHFLKELFVVLTSIDEIGILNFYKILTNMGVELAFMPKIVISESHVTTFKNERLRIIEQKQKLLERLTAPLDIEIYLFDDRFSKSFQTLAILIESLESIQGVNVVLEELRKGSVIAKIKVFFQSPEAKKQASELLESSRRFATGKLEKEFHENEKLKKETEKIEVEKQQLTQNLHNENSDGNIEKRNLEIESIKLDIEKKRLENQRLQLDNFTQKTMILKQLLSDQILSQEEFQILINKSLFISKSGDTITLGESIEEIESK